MGCQLSKQEDDTTREMENTNTVITMASEATAHKHTDVNYKSRLEWKMCVVSVSELFDRYNENSMFIVLPFH